MSGTTDYAARGPFAELLFDDDALAEGGRGSESDSWLMSYLDLLLLLVTFFVLMLALYGGQLASPEQPTTPPVTLALKVPAAVPPKAAPSAAQLGFYRPPRQLTAAPVASDVGFYAPRPAPPPLVPMTPLLFAVPLFDLPDPVDETLPQIDGVQVTAIPHGFNLRIQDHLLFDSSAVDVSDKGRALIEKMIPLLQEFQGTISVEGHTDSVPISTPQFPSNWELSAARAAAVVRALRLDGIDGGRLRAIGYASTEPLADNDTPAGRARNRRVELVLQEAGSDGS